jgi:branched-chain amino acid transport system substrate-binding protein
LQSYQGNYQDADEIRIGLITSLSGDDAEVGKATEDAARLAVEEANDGGGIDVGGRKHRIKLIIIDEQSKPEAAVSAAQILINQENVVAIVGPQYSRNAIPVAKFTETAHIPMISPRSTNPATTAGKRYAFRATFVDTFQGEVLAHFALEDLHAQRAAVLYDIASPYNQGLAEVFQQVFAESGGQVLAFESYTTGERNFKTQLMRIRSSNPDVLLLPNYQHEVPMQAQQARQLGIKATLLGADAWGAMRESDRHYLEGSFWSDQYAPDSTNEKTQAFIKRYRQVYGYEPETNAAATYDSMELLFQAIQREGKADPESIRQGLSTIGRYEGVTGTIEYRGTGDPIVSVVILHIKNGKAMFYKQIDPNIP